MYVFPVLTGEKFHLIHNFVMTIGVRAPATNVYFGEICHFQCINPLNAVGEALCLTFTSGVLYILHSCRVIGRNAFVHVNFSSSFLGTTLLTCDPCCSRDPVLASTAEGSQVSLSGLPE